MKRTLWISTGVSLWLVFMLLCRANAAMDPRPMALYGVVIAVDAGHGGYDGGAKSQNGRWEKQYNLDIALQLRDYLQEQGATVIMTRDGDYTLADPNPPGTKKRQDMERRVALAVGGNADLLISIHMNQYKDTRQSGPQVFFRKDYAQGERLARTVQQAMIDTLNPARKRTASAGDFYILRLDIPSILVECGFLSNPQEETLLRSPAYTQRIVHAIVDGIIQFWQQEPPTATGHSMPGGDVFERSFDSRAGDCDES